MGSHTQRPIDCTNSIQCTILMDTPNSVESNTTIKKSLLYTKTGDKGKASLFTGERVEKTHTIFECLGDLDELNAQIGVARQHCIQAHNGLNDFLEEIQSVLIDLGSNIATPRSSEHASKQKLAHTEFDPDHTEDLEKWTDQLDYHLPPLTNFILPSGGFSSAHIHVARAVCRRAERHIWGLAQQQEIDENVPIYLNRLSDFLFACARTASLREGQPEISYKKGKGKTVLETAPRNDNNN